jgi:hypothetical protein
MRSILLLALALSACQSLNQEDPTTRTAPHTRTLEERGTGAGSNRSLFVELATDYHAPVTSIEVPPARAWREVVALYGQLGLPVTAFDSAGRHIKSEGWNLRRTFNGQPMSRWVDCGLGAAAMRRADRYRIMGTLESIVSVGERGETRLLTSLRARGYDETGDSNNPVPCASTGELERWIANAVTLKAAGGG